MRGLKLLLVLLITGLAVPVSAQESPAPYIYYFDGTGFVIERADGSNARMLGKGISKSSLVEQYIAHVYDGAIIEALDS
jgi:hypothetical protein